MQAKFLIVAAASSAMLLSSLSVADARKWKAGRVQQALEYLQIEYQKSNEIVFVLWLSPSAIENKLETRAAREILGKYVVILVAHASVDALGQVKIIEPPGIALETSDKKAHRPLSDDGVPPALSGFLHTFGKVMAAGLGAVGKGMVAKVFSQHGIDDCRKGTFWVRYAGERFEYKTPVPGCELVSR